MFHIVLVRPEIPPNTGNIIRIAANTGAHLHLIKPLGFALEDKHLTRAGLDYREYAEVSTHDSLTAALLPAGESATHYAVTAAGTVRYDAPVFRRGDIFVFGPESAGLSGEELSRFPPPRRLAIPMQKNSRSFNLSNAVAIVIMEAWRQNGFRLRAPAENCQPVQAPRPGASG